MHAVNIVLYLGAFFLALFSFLFIAGSLGQLLGLIAEGVRALSGPRRVEAKVASAVPAAQPAIPLAAAQRPRRRPLASRFERYASSLAEPGWLRTCAVVVGLLAVGFAAVMVVGGTASPSHAVAPQAAQGAAAPAAQP
jgi:hypothetical protein